MKSPAEEVPGDAADKSTSEAQPLIVPEKVKLSELSFKIRIVAPAALSESNQIST
jgi:hypothetical protein